MKPPKPYNVAMTGQSFSSILAASLHRNQAIAAAYKEASRRLLSRAVSGLAASAAEQRRELGEELAALASSLSPEMSALPLELPDAVVALADSPVPGMDNPATIIAFFRDVEEAEHQLYGVLATAAAKDPDANATLSGFAEQARKRSSIASDHLDLLGLR